MKQQQVFQTNPGNCRIGLRLPLAWVRWNDIKNGLVLYFKIRTKKLWISNGIHQKAME